MGKKPPVDKSVLLIVDVLVAQLAAEGVVSIPNMNRALDGIGIDLPHLSGTVADAKEVLAHIQRRVIAQKNGTDSG